MKRSEINAAIMAAQEAFESAGWALPPHPRWDVTDFGLGCFREKGLVLVNLAEEPEYCEKIMFARRDQHTPAHCHLWQDKSLDSRTGAVSVRVNGEARQCSSGSTLDLKAGERVTLRPGTYHEFWPLSDTCVIGEVSTANDDTHDNFFADSEVGRFPGVEEDEPALIRLVSDR
jgi:D-lyxose ketol-isomerase